MEKKYLIGDYNLLDYNISHKVLLFRNKIDSESNQNVDLIFEAVFYLEVPTRLRNIVLFQADENTINVLLNKFNEKFYPEFGQTVFVIESENKQYFIGCNRYLIQENALDHLTSSIR